MTRRDWLCASGSMVLLLTGGPPAVLAKGRLSQQEAAYQNTPKGLRMCGTCTLFVSPNGCKVIDGLVERQGWCRLYDMND